MTPRSPLDWVLVDGGTLGACSRDDHPYMIRRAQRRNGLAFGGLVEPVVPPMVSAATGALLLHVVAAPARETLLYEPARDVRLSLVASSSSSR